MCLINFAFKIHPTFDLIVAANRDEFFYRPTAPVSYWEDAPHVLAGRDLEKMGTWMGVSKKGRFAALTNFRNPNEESGRRSRGHLVSQYLIGNDSSENYLSLIQRDRDQYPGFNLIVGDSQSLYYYSNIENKIRRIKPGLYGLSNHLLDTPWPKVKVGKEALANCLHSSSIDLKACLFKGLQNAEPAVDEELPATGVTLDWERKLSPLFIKTEEYGTRSSTLVFMDNRKVEFIERTYHVSGEEEREYTLTIKR